MIQLWYNNASTTFRPRYADFRKPARKPALLARLTDYFDWSSSQLGVPAKPPSTARLIRY